MHSLLRIAILVLVSFSPPLFLARYISAADAPEKLTLVRMGLAARSTTTMPFFVARERGFFREEGLEVELIVMQAIQTIQATMGKSTQFASARSRPNRIMRWAICRSLLAIIRNRRPSTEQEFSRRRDRARVRLSGANQRRRKVCR